MSWLKIDDGFAEHPKVSELTDRAFRLHMAALCFCARNLTDGILTARSVKVVCALTSAAPRHIAELRDAGLWVGRGDGWVVKDYLDYNPDAESVKALREQRREAGRLGATRRWHSKSDSTSHSKQDGKPGMPRPVPSQSRLKPTAVADDLEALQAAARLFNALQDVDEGTERVVLAFASELKPCDFDEVLASLEQKRGSLHKTDAAYAVGALSKRARRAA